MSAISLPNYKLLLRGIFGHAEDSTGGVAAKIDRIYQHQVKLKVPADADGDFTIAPASLWRAPQACRVLSVYWLSAAAVTADATDYTTLKLQKTNGVISTETTVASRATDTPTTDDIAALTPWALTLSATEADLQLAAGNLLGVVGVASTVTGVAVPAGVMLVYHTEI